MIYLPYTACSQIGYELIFLIGHPLNCGRRPPTRVEMAVVAVRVGRHPLHQRQPMDLRPRARRGHHRHHLIIMWARLIRPNPATESRIRCLWLAFAGIAMLISSTAVYFLAEVGAGFNDIGQGSYGLWFKFIGENVPFIVLPPVVLYSIHLQIDYLTRRAAGARTRGAVRVRAV